MICPDCQTELTVTDCKGIQIHECPACKGKWFEGNQLRLAKDRQDDLLRWLDFDPFGQDAEKLSIQADGKACPKCRQSMRSMTYRQSTIVVDKCQRCEGVWLSHGELARIIRYLERVVVTESASDYAKESFRQFVEIFRGKEGLISEVKDFLAVLYLLELRIAADHPSLARASENIYKYTPFR